MTPSRRAGAAVRGRLCAAAVSASMMSAPAGLRTEDGLDMIGQSA